MSRSITKTVQTGSNIGFDGKNCKVGFIWSSGYRNNNGLYHIKSCNWKQAMSTKVNSSYAKH